MRTITEIELKKIITLHKLWVDGYVGGMRADLSNVDLHDVDLRGANLHNAYLLNANLRGADLRRTDLSGATLHAADLKNASLCDADLCDAHLQNADLRAAVLRRADFRRANLRRADLQDTDLKNANLRGADLRGADLQYADLRDAYLQNADLRGANLNGADLKDVNLSDAILPAYEIVQDDTEIVGYKKSREGYLITLRIDKTAKRCNSLVGRKCRAESATVVKIEDDEGQTVTQAKSQFNPGVIYTVGEVIRADEYDDDITIECTGGIHFFITKKEAINY